jgi:surface polysaccharide O-acyltransferase-like enzyme
MTAQTDTKPRTRLFFLDNIRIYLTILVILHHATLAYGGSGDWSVRDPAVDDISPILFLFFNALNQTYFMSAFFLMAGYFTPRSFEKKGTGRFLIDRLIRLGIPILVYSTLIVNLNEYIVNVYARGVPYRAYLEYDPGHLWFLQLLFLFALIYVIFRALYTPSASKRGIQPDTFPPDKALWITIAVLTILTFLVRIVYPVGSSILNIQPGHLTHYIFCFYIGILAYRGDWFRHLSNKQGRRWGYISLAVIPFFFVMLVVGGVLDNEANVQKFIGGLHWHSLALALWETTLLIGITTFLLYFFREKLNRAGPTLKTMAASVFTVYIIHQTILIVLHTFMLPVDIPTVVKFFVVSLIAVPVCFLLSILIRKIPFVNRVL